MSKRRKKAQEKILGEIQNQLKIKAKKLGVEDKFKDVDFEEMKVEGARKILDDLNLERANLEYELQVKNVLDKESTIKLEKINMYISKAMRVIERHEKMIEKLTGKTTKMHEAGKEAAKKIIENPKISISR
jgi:hypothetical protein